MGTVTTRGVVAPIFQPPSRDDSKKRFQGEPGIKTADPPSPPLSVANEEGRIDPTNVLQLAKRDTDPIMSLELPNILSSTPRFLNAPRSSSLLPPLPLIFILAKERSTPLRATRRPSPRFVIVFMVFQRELEG